MKRNCKNCKYLSFWDKYFCNNPYTDTPKDITKDIVNIQCDLFEERKDKFWNYDGAEF